MPTKLWKSILFTTSVVCVVSSVSCSLLLYFILSSGLPLMGLGVLPPFLSWLLPALMVSLLVIEVLLRRHYGYRKPWFSILCSTTVTGVAIFLAGSFSTMPILTIASIIALSLTALSTIAHFVLVHPKVMNNADPNQLDRLGQTPAHDAAYTQRMASGISPLLGAVLDADSERVRTLLSQNADPNQPDNQGRTPFIAALALNNIEAVKLFLDNSNNPNRPDNLGRTPFQCALLMRDAENTESVKVFLDRDFNPNQPFQNGWTPLQICVCIARFSIVKLLLQYHAEINLPGHNGWTPLCTAVRSENTKMAELLLEYGANPNQRCEEVLTLLEIAIKLGNTKMADLLLRKGAKLHDIKPLSYLEFCFTFTGLFAWKPSNHDVVIKLQESPESLVILMLLLKRPVKGLWSDCTGLHLTKSQQALLDRVVQAEILDLRTQTHFLQRLVTYFKQPHSELGVVANNLKKNPESDASFGHLKEFLITVIAWVNRRSWFDHLRGFLSLRDIAALFATSKSADPFQKFSQSPVCQTLPSAYGESKSSSVVASQAQVDLLLVPPCHMRINKEACDKHEILGVKSGMLVKLNKTHQIYSKLDHEIPLRSQWVEAGISPITFGPNSGA